MCVICVLIQRPFIFLYFLKATDFVALQLFVNVTPLQVYFWCTCRGVELTRKGVTKSFYFLSMHINTSSLVVTLGFPFNFRINFGHGNINLYAPTQKRKIQYKVNLTIWFQKLFRHHQKIGTTWAFFLARTIPFFFF